MTTAVTFRWTYEPPFKRSSLTFHVASIYTIIPKNKLSPNIAWRSLLLFEQAVPNVTAEESWQRFNWAFLHCEPICHANSIDFNLAHRIPHRKCQLNLTPSRSVRCPPENAVGPWFAAHHATSQLGSDFLMLLTIQRLCQLLWGVPFRSLNMPCIRGCKTASNFTVSTWLVLSIVCPSEKKNRGANGEHSQHGKQS